MTTAAAVHLYERLKSKIGAEEAREPVDYVENAVELHLVEKAKNELATKDDVANLRLEIEKLRTGVRNEVAKLHADIMRWMFIFWIGQFFVVATLVFTVVRMLR